MSKKTDYKLVDKTTRLIIKEGSEVTTFGGEPAELVMWFPPLHAGSTGRVLIMMLNTGTIREFFPSVIGAEIVTRHPYVHARVACTSCETGTCTPDYDLCKNCR